MGLEPAELARWSRFAAKGGIGKCTATCDCVAESTDDLMFMNGDEITVLLQFRDTEGEYLGYCEGVVGRFSGGDVVFHSKLKKPVMAKRGSTHSTLSVQPSVSSQSPSPVPLRITKRTLSNSPRHLSSPSSGSTPSVQPSPVDPPEYIRSNSIPLQESPTAVVSMSPTHVDTVRVPSLDLFSETPNSASRLSIRTVDNGRSDEPPPPRSSSSSVPSSPPSSALDTSVIADTTFDDLSKNHPGRFSRFSIGPALTASVLLGPKPLPPKEGAFEGGYAQGRISVTTPPSGSRRSTNSAVGGRTSLSIAARGKVDEATLASTQAQVGIGLSLLQDLVGGMDSDSDSGSDYEAFDVSRSRRLEGGANAAQLVERTASRDSVSTEEGTVEGLMYASTDDVGQGVLPHNEVNGVTRARSPRTPTSPSSPRFPSNPAPYRQPNGIVDQRERRPSLAQSVVSGKSGTSGSWDDIYDNYRYSNFSMKSGRPSTASIRTRTDSGNGRLRSESIVEEKETVEEMESRTLLNSTSKFVDVADLQKGSIPADLDDSMYSQDSALSELSIELAAITIPKQYLDAAVVNRPTPSITGHPPLLLTNWIYPSSSSPVGMQTASPPFTTGVSTPQPGRVGAEGDAQMALSVPTTTRDDSGKSEDHLNGMASAMRHRIETGGRSPLPTKTTYDGDDDDDEMNRVDDSFGLGNGIVVQDEDDLPSRILTDDGDHGEFELDGADGLQLRPRNHHTQFVGPDERRSLFLPHPNAPKAPAKMPPNIEPGAGIGALSQAYSRSVERGPSSMPLNPTMLLPPPQPRPPVQAVIHMALSIGSRVMPPAAGRPATHALPTIYGRTEVDLATSIGPVPIVFSVDPPTTNSTGGKATAPMGAALPRIGAGGSIAAAIQDTRTTNPTSPPPPPPPSLHTSPPSSIGQRASTTPPVVPPPVRTFSSISNSFKSVIRPSTSSGVVMVPPSADDFERKSRETGENTGDPATKGSAPIPRPNFMPRVPGVRPRSRSFSGFNTQPDEQSNVSPEGKRQELNKSFPKRTISAAMSNAMLGSKKPIRSSPLRPSPLSASSVSANVDGPLVIAKASISITQGMSTRPSPNMSSTLLSTSRDQGQRAQSISSSQAPVLPTGFAQRSVLRQRRSGSVLVEGPRSMPTNGAIIDDGVQTQNTKLVAPPASTDQNSSLVAGSPQMGTNTVGQGPPNLDASGVIRQASLRAKLSLPNLKKNRNRDDDSISVYDRDLRDGPGKLFDAEFSSLQHVKDRPKEVVQVQDVEFELVRPSLNIQARNSEDSLSTRRDSPFDSGLLVPASPTVSLSSSNLRSPIHDTYASSSHSALNLDASLAQPSESIEAHRQRELKWVSLMSSSPASLSRKSKKVKKLLVEGVPSSVRYLIWSYLTDGKGRAVKGVYEQLCQRGEVTRTKNIAVDAERLFGVHEGDAGNDGMQYLHATKGPVIVLLQAYFSMVPDVQYSTGLAKIVGQLLLLAPEEDAFWIFTSIMDTHLRPYFTIPSSAPAANSSSLFRSTQIEVDGALYSRALEAADSPLSKKLFVDLGILPGVICQVWFTSLFVGVLPLDYINRVWDIFLYEGIPFLLRVALSLTSICRQFLISPTTNSDKMALAALARPPTQWLPPSPEAFLMTVMNVKLRDDVRKQRLKMGEIVKRQTQAQQGTNHVSVSMSGISLPRV